MKNLFNKRGLPEDHLAKGLKEAIAAEQISEIFYRYISEMIKNGHIRNRFKRFADDEAKTHKELLQRRLREIVGYDYNPDPAELHIPIEPQGFSLIGALGIVGESKERAVKFYKKARDKDRLEYRKMYEGIIKAEKKHWGAINREKRFVQTQECYSDLNGIGLFLLAIQ